MGGERERGRSKREGGQKESEEERESRAQIGLVYKRKGENALVFQKLYLKKKRSEYKR